MVPATNGFFFLSCSCFLASSLFFCHSFNCSMRRSRLSLSVGLAGRREENEIRVPFSNLCKINKNKSKNNTKALFFFAKFTFLFLLDFRKRYSPFRGEEVSSFALAFDVFLSRSFLPVSGTLPSSLLVEDVSFPIHGPHSVFCSYVLLIALEKKSTQTL